MMRKLFKFLLIFVLIVASIGIWFSQNWYKMPKYIAQIKNPTMKMFQLNGKMDLKQEQALNLTLL